MNYGRINKTDIANGPGVRVSLFVSGCRNRCKGCFQPETWDFNYGEEFTIKTFIESKKDISLKFRGSSNQRIIDVRKTRRSGTITLWEG